MLYWLIIAFSIVASMERCQLYELDGWFVLPHVHTDNTPDIQQISHNRYNPNHPKPFKLQQQGLLDFDGLSTV